MLSDPEFAQLLKRLSLSWEGYKKVRKGVKKRLRRRVGELGLKGFGDYLDLIQRDPDELARCRELLTVSISRFMRDPQDWQVISEEVLPSLTDRPRIRAWCAGCALGQEVYTLRLVYERLKRDNAELPPLDILATDLNPEYLAKAQEGVYTRSMLAPLEESERHEYFTKLPGKRWHQVSPALARGITWQEHDLLSSPPPDGFDLLFLRNSVLTYQQKPEQEAILKQLLEVISPGGYLIIGAKESLPREYPELQPHDQAGCIFQKTG